MHTRLLALSALLVLAVPASAQTVREHIERGDRAVIALDATAAQRHYRAAIAADSTDSEGFWKASRTAIDLGEYERDGARQKVHFAEAEQLARRAVALDPRSAEAQFALARALGRTALSLGTRERIRYATAVREHAMAALAIDSTHAGALHVMGVWNAEVMRLNGVSRAIARNFLGGQVFGSANWVNAVRYMELAVASEPEGISHRLDLAKIYLDLADGKRAAEYRARARAELERALRASPRQYNDRHYRAEAEQLLRSL